MRSWPWHPLANQSPLWCRTALDRVGPWDESLQHVGHDHQFHIRALSLDLRIYKLRVVDYYWRVPRPDSLTSLESFRTRHGDGGMIAAYRKIMAEVSGMLTPRRRRVMSSEEIRLAVNCRNVGGSPSGPELGLLDARRFGFIGPLRSWACRLLLRCWWRIAGRLPAMSLMNRLASRAEQTA